MLSKPKPQEMLIVRFIDSIAGLADPNTVKLDQKYQLMRQKLTDQGTWPEMIESAIAQQKKQDRYDDVCRGFPKDFSYRPGQEARIPADIARAWAEDGICELLPGFTTAQPVRPIEQLR